jgi:CheY-like chemotaxis protein
MLDSDNAATGSPARERTNCMHRRQTNGKASRPDPAPDRGGSSPAALQGRAVLVIEDDDDAREVMALILRSCGAVPRTAVTGEDGLRLMGEECFDAVICDLGLPGIDGFEVARRARSLPTHKRARLIALTGFGQTRDVRQALQAGFDAHLTKPVEAERLLQLLLGTSGHP